MKKSLLFIFAIGAAIGIANAQPSINDDFFEKVSYVGAFGKTDWTTQWSNYDCQNTAYSATTVDVEGEITASTTWTADKIYLLKGFVYVTDGATLTIQAGTVIRGEKSSKGSLIIERGGKINAEGTVDKPIIFTSNEAAGSRVRGDWGGLVLCGKAPVNVTGGEAQIEGGPRTFYGGTVTDDNSGILKYVRVEFAGYPFQKDKEINGITFGGVGSGTKIDYVQVSYSNDDSYEWFGGTVNAKHLIAYRGLDDEFDTDFGFSGHLQFLVSLRDSAIADISGSNGFESDNDAKGTDNTPFTSAVFSNASLFGPKENTSSSFNPLFKKAMHIRRNSNISIYNSIFAGWPTGVCIDGTKSEANALTSKTLKIENSVISGSKESSFFAVGVTNTTTEDSLTRLAAIRNWFLATNDTLATNDLLNLEDPFNYASPKFTLKSGASLKTASIWATTAITITAEGNKSEITTDGGTLQLSANILPANANNDIDWSVNAADKASVDATGKVTAIANGIVIITATAKDGSELSSTFEVTISNQDVVSAVKTVNNIDISVYPNPFTSQISYSIPSNVNGMASIEIFDVTGKSVAHLFNGNVNGGEELTFNVKLNNGVYFSNININGTQKVVKLICQ